MEYGPATVLSHLRKTLSAALAVSFGLLPLFLSSNMQVAPRIRFSIIRLYVTLLQVFIALRFGTAEGEGGCFALYHGLIPPPSATAEEDRTLTGDSFRNVSSEYDKRWLYKLKWVLLPWVSKGPSLLYRLGLNYLSRPFLELVLQWPTGYSPPPSPSLVQSAA